MLKLILKHGYQHDRGVPHERVPQDSGRTVTNAQNTTLHHMTRTRLTKGSTSSKSSAFARFCAIGNKNAGNSQQKARRERLFIRKTALSAIFCCGFGAEMR